MSENVIDIRTRKTREIPDPEVEKLKEEEARKSAMSEHHESLLRYLDQVRDLILDGKLETLVLISRHIETGHYHTASIIDAKATDLTKVYGHIGVLETMKLELMEVASMAPALMEDGSTIDPYKIHPDINPSDDEFGFEEDD